MKKWRVWGEFRILFEAKKPLESDTQIRLEIPVAVFFHPCQKWETEVQTCEVLLQGPDFFQPG